MIASSESQKDANGRQNKKWYSHGSENRFDVNGLLKILWKTASRRVAETTLECNDGGPQDEFLYITRKKVGDVIIADYI